MRVVRAWPAAYVPAHRPRVLDGWPRVTVDNYDYRALADVGDDVISMDWDQAVDLADLRRFAANARRSPDEVLVAPTLIWQDGDAVLPDGPKWNVKRFHPGMTSLYWLEEGSERCNLFGFGVIYLPQSLIKRFLAGRPGAVMDDTTFAVWHYQEVRPEARVDWTVRPVHLHYPIPDGGII